MEREEFDDIREEPEREIYRMLENDIQMNIRKRRRRKTVQEIEVEKRIDSIILNICVPREEEDE